MVESPVFKSTLRCLEANAIEEAIDEGQFRSMVSMEEQKIESGAGNAISDIEKELSTMSR